MLKKLQKRFILITMILVGAVILAGVAIFCGVTFQQQSSRLDNALEAAARQALSASIYGSSGSDSGSKNTDPLLKTYSVLADDSGNVLYQYGNANEVSDDVVWSSAIRKVIAAGGSEGKISKYDLLYKRVGVTFSNRSGYSIISFVDYSQLESYIMSTITMAAILFGTLMLVMFAVSWILSKLAIRPVQRAWDQQQQFIADASHELKTPLTVILANNNILLSHRDWTGEKQRKWIENTQTEAAHMKNLVDNLLYLARSDANKSKTVFSSVPLGEITMDIALRFEPVAFEKGLGIDYTKVDTEISVQGDSTKLKQLVHILIDNACKYGEKGSDIDVVLQKKNDKVFFSVHNKGKEIAQEDLPHLFERFYRANKARNREEGNTGGYGLGLAIAKSIADDHGAKISVTSTKEQGTTFTIEFKKL